MGKPLGIAAFVILLLSIPIPVLGIWLAFIALLLGAAAGFQGEKTWAVVVGIVGFVVLFWMSPAWHLVMFPPQFASDSLIPGLREHNTKNGTAALLLTVIAVALPFAGAFAAHLRSQPTDTRDEPDA